MNFKRLIELNIEIEGLLRVLDNRPDNTEAMSLLRERHSEFSGMLKDENENDCNVSYFMVCAINEYESTADGASIIILDDEDPDNSAPEISETVSDITKSESQATSPQNNGNGLRRCFTLNDKFRFIRELFGGNEREFSDTLAIISGMPDYTEAEAYLCNDLTWDREDPCVAEFLSIIAANMPAQTNGKQ